MNEKKLAHQVLIDSIGVNVHNICHFDGSGPEEIMYPALYLTEDLRVLKASRFGDQHLRDIRNALEQASQQLGEVFAEEHRHFFGFDQRIKEGLREAIDDFKERIAAARIHLKAGDGVVICDPRGEPMFGTLEKPLKVIDINGSDQPGEYLLKDLIRMETDEGIREEPACGSIQRVDMVNNAGDPGKMTPTLASLTSPPPGDEFA